MVFAFSLQWPSFFDQIIIIERSPDLIAGHYAKLFQSALFLRERHRASQYFRSYLPHSLLQSEWSGALLVAVSEG